MYSSTTARRMAALRSSIVGTRSYRVLRPDGVVAGERFTAGLSVVDDRGRVAGRRPARQRPRLVHRPAGDVPKLGDPPADVLAVRVVGPALGRGVEDPDV